MNKLIGVDLLRAFAAFSVFYYHQHIGHLIAKFSGISWFNTTDIVGAVYAVPLFFLLSGYCIHLSSFKQKENGEALDLKKYYLNRFLRIYPAYLFAIIISILITYISFNKKPAFEDLLIHLIVGQGFSSSYFNSINLVLWTITVEVAFYIIYPIYYYLNQQKGINKALLFSFFVSLISNTICFFFVRDLSITTIFLFTNLWFGWCFGAWLCDKYHKEPVFFKSTNWIIIVSFLICIFIFLQFYHFENELLIHNIINILIWAPIFILTLQAETFFIRYRKWLAIPVAIGIASYSLYLLHMPLILLKNFLIHKYFNNSSYILLMAIGTVLIPFVSYLAYRTIELPFFNLRRKYFTKPLNNI
jgi:peptidoglycan/LPS O-acetylase OafA/YrhL